MTKAYLEDYRVVKIISSIDPINQNYPINDSTILLDLKAKFFDGSMWHAYLEAPLDLLPHVDYYINYFGDNIHLDLGCITRSTKFDDINYYEEELGYLYNKEYTIFKLWAPVCKEVLVEIDSTIYQMNYTSKGVYEVRVNGNLKNCAYRFKARINEDYFYSLDPYGKSIDPTHKYNYVIDLENTYKMEASHPQFSGKLDEAIIYETHLLDMTCKIPGSSAYLNATDSTIVNYFTNLGITHLQIMPVNAFEEVDEVNKDKLYNWGYNPTEYMALSNWYASNPYDPECAINEFKKLVDTYHHKNISINLDVVFNHVYKLVNFSYGRLIPGYVGRCDNIGYLTDGSGCGNDLATEHKMIRKLFVDTCKFYTSFYKIDGYRFDLMGLIDIETINTIKKEVSAIYPHSIFYGEAWKMKTGLADELLASNVNMLDGVGYFHDGFRNMVKGNPFDLSYGLLMGEFNKDWVKAILSKDPMSLNFIECHDNYTLFDQLHLVNKSLPIEKYKDYLKLGLALMFLSPGVPFIHLGLEFGRSKKGISNSFNSPIAINGVDFNKTYHYQDVINYLKELIVLRKEIGSIKPIVCVENDNYLVYMVKDYKLLITNSYKDIIYNGLRFNQPGIYKIK